MTLDIPPKLDPTKPIFENHSFFKYFIALRMPSTASDIVIFLKSPSLSQWPKKSNLNVAIFSELSFCSSSILVELSFDVVNP
jgi:hypothetical protein